MIHIRDAEAQVRRLAHLPGYEAPEELVRIAALAQDAAWCATIIEIILDSGRCPEAVQFRRMMRPPRPEHWPISEPPNCPRQMCDGKGWIREFWLHTKTGDGRYSYVRKEQITEEQHNQLVHTIDWNTQRLYEGVRKCPCSD